MKWIIAIVAFLILSSIFDEFNCRARKLEERMSKLEEALESHSSNEDE